MVRDILKIVIRNASSSIAKQSAAFTQPTGYEAYSRCLFAFMQEALLPRFLSPPHRPASAFLCKSERRKTIGIADGLCSVVFSRGLLAAHHVANASEALLWLLVNIEKHRFVVETVFVQAVQPSGIVRHAPAGDALN